MPTPLRIALILIALLGLTLWGADAWRRAQVPLPPGFDTLDPMVQRSIEQERLLVARTSGSADAWLALGHLYYANDMAATAITCYERALALDPAHAEARYLLARHAIEEGRTADAEALLREILRDHPANISVNWYLGTLLLDDGRSAEAAAMFTALEHRFPGHAAAVIGLARAMLGEGDADGAAALLRPLSEPSAHTAPLASRYLSLALRRAGRAEEAADIAVHAAAPPPWPDPWFERMQARRTGFAALRLAVERAMHARDYRRADQALDELVTRNPDDPDLWNMRAVAHVELGRLDQGIAAMEHAITLAPQRPDPRFNLVRILERANPGDPRTIEQAKRVLEPLLADDRSRADALIRLASLLLAGRLFDQAAEHALAASLLPERPIEASLLRATIEEASQRPEQARTLLSELVQRFPGDARPWAALALAHARARDESGARSALDRARALRFPQIEELQQQVDATLRTPRTAPPQ